MTLSTTPKTLHYWSTEISELPTFCTYNLPGKFTDSFICVHNWRGRLLVYFSGFETTLYGPNVRATENEIEPNRRALHTADVHNAVTIKCTAITVIIASCARREMRRDELDRPNKSHNPCQTKQYLYWLGDRGARVIRRKFRQPLRQKTWDWTWSNS